MAFEDISVKIGADIGSFTKSMQQVESQMGAMGQKVSGAGQAMATTFGAAGGAIAAGLGFAVNKSMDFESQISRVGAIAGATGSELDALRNSALELGASTSKSASEVAVAQEGLAALGFTATDVIAAMPGVISAAESSGADMAQTAEVMASALNIFGLEAAESTRVADILAQTANMSAADINDMGYALKYAGPVAANLGVSMEELSASIGIMTNAGLDGSSAGTALRAGLLSLLNPSNENSKVMEAMGIQMTDNNGKFVGLSGVVQQLGSSMEGMTDAQKTATLASLVGTEASSGFLALMSAGPAEIDKMTASLENSGGASATAAAAMKDNLKGAMEEMGGAVETLQISIGTALTPAIQAATVFVTGLANAFNGLSPQMQSMIAIGAAVTAAVLLLGAALGGILMVVGGVMSAIAALGGVMAILGTALAVLTSPITLTIAGLVALGAAFAVLWAKSQTFRTVVTQAFTAIQQAAMQVFNFIRPYVIQAITAIQTSVSQGLNAIRAFWQQNGAQIMTIARAVWSVVQTIFSTYLANIVAVAKAGFTVLAAVVKTVFNVIKAVVTTVMKVIGGIVKTVLAVMRGDWSGALNAIKGIVSAVFNGIRSVVTSVMNGIRSVITSVWNGIKSTVTSAVNGIKSIVTSVFNALKSTVSGAMNGVRTAIVDGWNRAKSFLSSIDLSTIGRQIIQGLVNGIRAAAGGISDAVSAITDKIPATIKKLMGIHSPSRVTMALGKHTANGLAIGIRKNGKGAANAAAQVARNVTEKMKNLEVKYDTKKLSPTAYIAGLKKIASQFKLTGDQSRKMQKEIYAANQALDKADAKRSKTRIQQEQKVMAAQTKALANYKKQFADLKSSFNPADLFSAAGQGDTTGKELLANLRTQVWALDDYRKNIVRLAKRGVSGGLLDELKTAGPKASEQIAALAKLSLKDLKAYMSLYSKRNKITSDMAKNQLKSQVTKSKAALKTAQGQAKGEKLNEKVLENVIVLDGKVIGRSVQQYVDDGQRKKLNVKTAISGVRT
jgi:TP901 family phage tail tape measure protein